ncbi:MAG TPA: hypothetical protein VFT95_23015, partial [Micromonosporaceae bacterium]|nr:hypothetical protein [Micromonosporaceae bacterium]
PTWLAIGALVALAVASLVLPAPVTYDAWGWLQWGREVGRLDLDTTAGPAWKPLPVLATTVLSLFGDLAPVLWQVAARATGLLALVGAYRVAARFAGSAAGVLAAAALVLIPDSEARLFRLLAEAHTGPLEAALTLWWIELHLEERTTGAFAAGVALALLRPEAWPFLLVYGVWLWRRRPQTRRLLVGGAVIVPLLWFGGDWWGSGSPWNGSSEAQVYRDAIATRAGRALSRLGDVVIVPVWVAAVGGVLSAWRRRDRPLVLIAGAGAVWAALVVAMSAVLGYAALSRFLIPTAAIVCVLAGIGVVRAVRAVPAGPTRALAMAAMAVLTVPFAWPRLAELGDAVREIPARAELDHDLDTAIERAGGTEIVLSCGRVAIDNSGAANGARPALGWKLDLPMSRVSRRLGEKGGVMFARVGRRDDAALAGAPATTTRPLARTEHWAVYAVGCPDSA